MSKVQFNLLPEVKLQRDRAQRIRKLVLTISIVAVAASLLIFLLLFLTVDVLQKKQMDSASQDVDKASNQLKNIPQISQIITVQNQLLALAQLHQSKHAVSRIFVYLPQITPADVSINKLDLDTTASTMTISGTANSQASVNTFVDNLKQTTYQVNSGDTPVAAFPSVVESAFVINPTSTGYTINLQFDAKLFANNLVDGQGKAVTPKVSIRQTSPSSNLKDPASTLFNSSQTSTEGR